MKTKEEQKEEAQKAYKAIVDPAREIYLAKLREIDEDDIKIINGKKYKLVEEEN